MSPPLEPALRALTLTTLPCDPRRLALLADALQDGRERPGQVRALVQSDCGLCRQYWQDIHSAQKLVWLGLAEVLTAQSRGDLRRWVSARQRQAASLPAPEAERHEVQRLNALRRALIGLQIFQTAWAQFDPAAGSEPGVPGVRSAFERYLLMLRDRMFLANLGVLPVAEWFRLPVEALTGLDADRLRTALEQRWAATAAFFPPLDAAATAWTSAHAAAGDLFPSAAAVTAQVADLLRTAGLHSQPERPLVAAPSPA